MVVVVKGGKGGKGGGLCKLYGRFFPFLFFSSCDRGVLVWYGGVGASCSVSYRTSTGRDIAID